MKKEINRKETLLALDMVEKKVYYNHDVGEHGQRQNHLGESRVYMTLSLVRRQEGKERGRERNLK